jgi:hypothetical protein
VVVGSSLLLVGGFGGYCSWAVHNACFNASPPMPVPDPGSPRGNYCSIVIPEKPWIVMLIAPCALVLVTGLVARREGVAFFVAAVLCVVLFANSIVANSLAEVTCETSPLSCLR